MDRYSKIKLGNNTHKSRSMDFSDLHLFHHEKIITSPKTSESIQIIKNLPDLQEEAPEKNHGIGSNTNGNSDVVPSFGLPKLTRNGSVSSSIKSASKRFRPDNNNKQSSSPRTITAIGFGGGMQSVVKRAFSMRRSSSVSERYCRIHDQCVTLASSPLHDDDGIVGDNDAISRSQLEMEKKKKKKKKKQGYSSGRLFKACKKFLRL